MHERQGLSIYPYHSQKKTYNYYCRVETQKRFTVFIESCKVHVYVTVSLRYLPLHLLSTFHRPVKVLSGFYSDVNILLKDCKFQLSVKSHRDMPKGNIKEWLSHFQVFFIRVIILVQGHKQGKVYKQA